MRVYKNRLITETVFSIDDNCLELTARDAPDFI